MGNFKTNIMKYKKIIFSSIFLTFTLVLLVFNKDVITKNPLISKYTFNSPSNAYIDYNDNIYIVDGSGMDIIKGNKDGEIDFIIKGGTSSNKGFYNLGGITSSEDGRIFIHGIRFKETSLYILDERILEYSSKGKFTKEIFKVSYEDNNLSPRQYGLIKGLTCKNGNLYFSLCSENNIEIYTTNINSNNESYNFNKISQYSFEDAWKSIHDVCIHLKENKVFCTDKKGIIWTLGETNEILFTGGPISEEYSLQSTPYRLSSSSDNELFFSDLGMWNIRKINLDTKEVSSVIDGINDSSLPKQEDREILYPVSYNNSKLLTVGNYVYSINLKTNPASKTTIENLNYSSKTMLRGAVVWIFCLCSIIICIFALIYLFKYIVSPKTSFIVKASSCAVIGTIIISVFISSLVISRSNENIKQTIKGNIMTISSLTNEAIDTEAFSRINSNSDYLNQDYQNIKEQMDAVLNAASENNIQIYYMLYKNVKDIAIGVMDSENFVSPAFPSVIVPEFYNQAAFEGRKVYDEINDLSGMWALCMSPILNKFGDTIGVLEIGIDMYAYSQYIQKQTLDIALNVGTLALIIILLIIEISAFSPVFKKSNEFEKNQSKHLSGECVSIIPEISRLLMFLVYVSNSLQSSFVPSMAMSAYDKEIFGIPKNIGGTLPVVVEMLAAATFSTIGGKLQNRLDCKKLMNLGAITSAIGYLIIGFIHGYSPLFWGKLLTGAGLGLCIVSLNSAAALLPEKSSQKAFSGISVGIISGIQVGIVIGSLLVEFFGYNNIFLFSAIVCLCIIFISYFMFNPTKSSPVSEENHTKNNAFKFLFSSRAGAFLIFIIIPAYIGATIIDYYIPIFSLESGLSETNVGQISLIYGIFMIFIEPIISPYVIKCIGLIKSIYLALSIFILGIFIFSTNPNIITMIIMVASYGISLGLGYAARSSYFSSLSETKKFGIDKAMGYFGMYENITQTFAPLLISPIMFIGVKFGSSIIATILLSGLILYFIVMCLHQIFKKRVD